MTVLWTLPGDAIVEGGAACLATNIQRFWHLEYSYKKSLKSDYLSLNLRSINLGVFLCLTV